MALEMNMRWEWESFRANCQVQQPALTSPLCMIPYWQSFQTVLCPVYTLQHSVFFTPKIY